MKSSGKGIWKAEFRNLGYVSFIAGPPQQSGLSSSVRAGACLESFSNIQVSLTNFASMTASENQTQTLFHFFGDINNTTKTKRSTFLVLKPQGITDLFEDVDFVYSRRPEDYFCVR